MELREAPSGDFLRSAWWVCQRKSGRLSRPRACWGPHTLHLWLSLSYTDVCILDRCESINHATIANKGRGEKLWEFSKFSRVPIRILTFPELNTGRYRIFLYSPFQSRLWKTREKLGNNAITYETNIWASCVSQGLPFSANTTLIIRFGAGRRMCSHVCMFWYIRDMAWDAWCGRSMGRLEMVMETSGKRSWLYKVVLREHEKRKKWQSGACSYRVCLDDHGGEYYPNTIIHQPIWKPSTYTVNTTG